MVIVRYEPGDVALLDGAYALVGHDGEATSMLTRRRKGERLPPATGVDVLVAPAWFVRLAEESSMRAAA